MRLELGKPARTSDQAVAKLADVVIDAASGRVTHLVVQPGEDQPARLVPIELVQGDGELSLSISSDALKELEAVQAYEFIRPGESLEEDPKWDVGVEDVYTTPSYGAADIGVYGADPSYGMGIAYDRVPKGEVELRRASSVYSADDHHLGHVDGLVVDDSNGITHLLFERGHFWWRREISIPADAVASFATDMVKLGVNKQEAERFPSQRRR
jgi:sporulation protein YlmC with PRC-barrel domain